MCEREKEREEEEERERALNEHQKLSVGNHHLNEFSVCRVLKIKKNMQFCYETPYNV